MKTTAKPLILELDADCYPTNESLQAIVEWQGSARDLLDAVGKVWNLRSWGWEERTVPDELRPGRFVRRYNISTAGWSGNESLIGAMQENTLFWIIAWVQSRRGGHYIFEVRERRQDSAGGAVPDESGIAEGLDPGSNR